MTVSVQTWIPKARPTVEAVRDPLSKAGVLSAIDETCFGHDPVGHAACKEFADDLKAKHGEDWWRYFYCLQPGVQLGKENAIKCTRCGTVVETMPPDGRCPVCGALLHPPAARRVTSEVASDVWMDAVITSEMRLLDGLGNFVRGTLIASLAHIAIQMLDADLLAGDNRVYAPDADALKRLYVTRPDEIVGPLYSALRERTSEDLDEVTPANTLYSVAHWVLLREIMLNRAGPDSGKKLRAVMEGMMVHDNIIDEYVALVSDREKLRSALDSMTPTAAYRLGNKAWANIDLFSGTDEGVLYLYRYVLGVSTGGLKVGKALLGLDEIGGAMQDARLEVTAHDRGWSDGARSDGARSDGTRSDPIAAENRRYSATPALQGEVLHPEAQYGVELTSGGPLIVIYITGPGARAAATRIVQYAKKEVDATNHDVADILLLASGH